MTRRRTSSVPDAERCTERRGRPERRCINRKRFHVKLEPGGWEGDLCGVHAGPYQRAQEREALRRSSYHGSSVGRTTVTPLAVAP